MAQVPVVEPVVASGERAAMAQQSVIITGGSGYLGQFLVEEFAKTDKVAPKCPIVCSLQAPGSDLDV